jgi:hypothetical protein
MLVIWRRAELVTESAFDGTFLHVATTMFLVGFSATRSTEDKNATVMSGELRRGRESCAQIKGTRLTTQWISKMTFLAAHVNVCGADVLVSLVVCVLAKRGDLNTNKIPKGQAELKLPLRIS